MYSSGFNHVSVKQSKSRLWSLIKSFTKSAFVERTWYSVSQVLSIVSVYCKHFLFVEHQLNGYSINWFGRFLYSLVRGTDTVSIVWYLGEGVSMCWELTDFCDVRRLADGRFSQSVLYTGASGCSCRESQWEEHYSSPVWRRQRRGRVFLHHVWWVRGGVWLYSWGDEKMFCKDVCYGPQSLEEGQTWRRDCN